VPVLVPVVPVLDPLVLPPWVPLDVVVPEL
jgi:hypothetical protein